MASTSELRSSLLFQVRDHVCVVTGGGTGIGLMASQALAANGTRKEVLDKAAVAHTPENGSIIPMGPCDVKKKEDLDVLVKEISSKEKHVNVLVTSAGIPGTKAEPGSSDAEEMKEELWEKETVEAWNEVYSADVTSVYFTTIAFLPLLQAAKQSHEHFHPSVITISSMSGIVRNAQAHFNYNAAKGATIQLTKMMSAEFLKLGVRVNSIAPGYFPSELTAKESGSDQKSALSDEYVKSKGHVPIQRHGLDQEMAQTILFLTKNMYVNGQIIAVDGGVINVLGGA
ncbi:MAG: hypothetical protein Q9159_005061 [Coniocarpon cinnabarinum]